MLRVLVCALALLIVRARADVSGCGGFVELAKPLKEKLDYSQIKLELVSAGGVVKAAQRADCAPNGYYFIPIYDKGEFTLRVQAADGWTFSKVSVGEGGACKTSSAALDSKGDLNFRLTGFVVSGALKHHGSGCTGGLGGVEISLTNAKGTLLEVTDETGSAEKTSTAADGTFSFRNVASDAYTLSASHARWLVTAEPQKVTVGLGNVRVEKAFEVMGYDVSGRVHSSTGEAVSGVEFLLYGSDASAVYCSKPVSTDLPTEPTLGRALCSASSDASGAFALSGVSCGQFVLRAYYQKSGTTFDLSPASIPLKITGGSHTIEKPFQVVGFSVRGRVVDTKGAPVSDVKISLGHGNLPSAHTDSNGAYRLEGVSAGKYTVTAFKHGINFNVPPANTQLSPNNAVLSDITVQSYDVCGRIDLEESAPFSRHRDVTLSGRKLRTTDKGLFCFDAPPGRYSLAAVVTAEEAAAGLAFKPASVEVTVVNEPRFDIILSQARIFITGSVHCLSGVCTSPVSVHLKGLTRSHSDAKEIAAGASPLRFSFGVLPGNYRVSVDSPTFCFATTTEDIDASTDKDVKFTQTGHLLVVETTHSDVSLEYKSADEKVSGTLRLGPRTKECLSASGIYTLTPSSCLRIPTVTYDTAKPAVVKLAATHLSVPVSVKGPKDVTLTVKSSNGVDTKLTGTYDKGVNSFVVFASAPETLTLSPILPKDSTQQVYPTSKSVTVNELKCVDEVKFVARDSVYLTGSVKPAIEGVEITVLNDETQEVIVTGLTDSSGRYKVGPLRDDVTTRLVAHKSGFQLMEEADGTFRALKLSHVTVAVKDENGAALPDVVLSLSGDSSYRVNNVTQADGSYTFRDLFSGTYYLRPVLKEYQFTPTSHSITLSDGEEKKITLSAKRVAYSVFGSVRSLSGDPERNFVVHATASNGDVEETSSDASGEFRLRGLNPGQQYTVSLRPGSESFERSSPSSMTVEVKNEDARLGPFTVIRKSTKLDLFGRVNTSTEYIDTLKVELHQKEKDSSLRLVSTAPLGPADVFLFPGLSPASSYVLRLKSDLNTAAYVIKTEDVAVDTSKAENGRVFVSLSFKPTPRSHSTEVQTRPLWGVLLALAALVAALNRERTLRLIRRVSESSLFRGRQEEDDGPVIRNRQGQIVGRGTGKKNE